MTPPAPVTPTPPVVVTPPVVTPPPTTGSPIVTPNAQHRRRSVDREQTIGWPPPTPYQATFDHG
jgi:hypothetical protein